MSAPPTVIYLDAYPLGDPLFVTGLARDLEARAKRRLPGLVLVHGAGEAGERAVEGTGAVVRREGGIVVAESEEAKRVVERAARDLNRQIVHELNEAGVAALRVIGADRGLLKRSEGGGARVGKAGWVADLVRQGVVVTVATLVDDGGDALLEVDPAAAAGALAQALGEGSVGVVGMGRAVPVGPLGADAAQQLAAEAPGADALRRLTSAGVPVEVLKAGSLRGAEG